MIVTIDGPAGAGKSTVARQLAQQLGFRFLDTGAMYRAVVLAAQLRGVPWDDEPGLLGLVDQMRLEFAGETVLLDGRDVTLDIRLPQVTEAIHHVADNPRIRRRLVERQRELAAGGNFVTEGRDQGTVAFPHAECKVFLTASAPVRAQRRWHELQSRQPGVTLQQVQAQQDLRDDRDTHRAVGGLRPAEDAIRVNTDELTQQEVVRHLVGIVRQLQAAHEGPPATGPSRPARDSDPDPGHGG